MLKFKIWTNELKILQITKTTDLCKNGMDDMHILYLNYNIIAFFVTKLRFVCNARHIMTIIEKNYGQPPLCNDSKPRLDHLQAGFVH